MVAKFTARFGSAAPVAALACGGAGGGGGFVALFPVGRVVGGAGGTFRPAVTLATCCLETPPKISEEKTAVHTT